MNLLLFSIGARIADVFDHIIGTSAGGIVALRLRMRVPVAQIIQEYEQIVQVMFPKGAWSAMRGLCRLLFGGWYDVSRVERLLNEQYNGNAALNTQVSRVGVVTRNLATRQAYIITPERHGHLTLTKTIRMTTAADLPCRTVFSIPWNMEV